MASPSWLATHPPTPMTSSGLIFLRCCTRPRSEKTFSCAFSRTEQVLKRMMSASSGVLVSSRPWSPRSPSTILSESYSFIWQPNVRMYSLRAPGRAGGGAAAAVVEGAAAEAPARLIEVSCMACAVPGVDPGGVVSNGEAPLLTRRWRDDLVGTQLAI